MTPIDRLPKCAGPNCKYATTGLYARALGKERMSADQCKPTVTGRRRSRPRHWYAGSNMRYMIISENSTPNVVGQRELVRASISIVKTAHANIAQRARAGRFCGTAAALQNNTCYTRQLCLCLSACVDPFELFGCQHALRTHGDTSLSPGLAEIRRLASA